MDGRQRNSGIPELPRRQADAKENVKNHGDSRQPRPLPDHASERDLQIREARIVSEYINKRYDEIEAILDRLELRDP